MPKARVPGRAELNYEVWGPATAPRLLILSPSVTALPDLFPYIRGTADAPTTLATSFRCLAFDHRGTGKSEMPRDSWPAPSINVFAEDAFGLLDTLGWSSASILAISFGAAVAKEMLLRGSNTFAMEHLLMVCPACDVGIVAGFGFDLSQLLTISAHERTEHMLKLADTRRDDEWFQSEMGEAARYYVDDMEQKLPHDATEGRRYQYEARREHKTVDRLSHATGRKVLTDNEAAGETAVDTLLLSADKAVPDSWPRAVAIFAATHDGIAPPPAVKRLSDAISGSTLVWWHSGHWPNLGREYMRRFNAEATAFLLHGAVAAKALEASVDAERQIVDWQRAPLLPKGLDCCNIL